MKDQLQQKRCEGKTNRKKLMLNADVIFCKILDSGNEVFDL